MEELVMVICSISKCTRLRQTWDAQKYVLRELKLELSLNQPCNSVVLRNAVIL